MRRLTCILLLFAWVCSAQFPKPIASGRPNAVPGIQSGEYLYCPSAVGTDSYACNLTPAITAYTVGMAVNIKADVANTGVCTLALNGLAAKPIKRGHDVDPADGEIEVGTIFTVIYDGTNWQMQSQTGLGGGAVGGFSNLPDPDVIPRVSAAGMLGPSAVSENGVKFYTTAVRTFGFGLSTRTGNTEPGTTKFVLNDLDLAVLNSATLGSEQFTNGALTAGTSWSAAGDCALAGDALACSYAAGTGSLTQANATLAIKIPDSNWMTWTYVVSGVSGTVTASLPATICDSTAGLSCVVDVTAGSKTFKFKTVATASTAAFVTNFVLAAASGLTFDTLSLKEIRGGNAYLYGGIYLASTRESTHGVIFKDGLPFIHNYAAAGSDGLNTFSGLSAGNFTMGPAGGASYLGSYNSVQGANALWNNTTGHSNSVQGRGALFSNTTGPYNSAQGVYALYSNTSGSSNSVQGVESGYTETPANANITGSQNVWIGYQAGPGVSAQLDNSIGIGYRSHPVASNQAVFGNSSITSTILYGQVGLGNSAPDIAYGRLGAGSMEVTSGAAGKPAGLTLGTIALQSLATPTITSVTPQGTPGSQTWTYTAEACLADGVTCSAPSAPVSTTTGAATLNTTDNNRILVGAVTGATTYRFRRTVSGGTPATLGLFAATLVTAVSSDDVGAAGDSATLPTNNNTGLVRIYNGATTVGVGQPYIRGSVPVDGASASHNAAITTTNLLAAAVAGTYRASAYLHTTTVSAGACTSNVTIGWTANSGAKTYDMISAHSHAVDEVSSQGVAILRSDDAQNITYAASFAGADCSNGVYLLYLVLERLQ